MAGMTNGAAVSTADGGGRHWRWAKRIGLVVGLVLLLGVAGLFVAAQLGERKMQRRIAVEVPAVALPEDARAVSRGGYLYMSRGCGHCHGPDGGGRVVVDDGKGLRVTAPNITPSGVVGSYSTADWTRTIRHGVKPDGRPAMIMPSEDYNRLTDEDLGALIAFVRQMQPVPGEPAVLELPLFVKALYGVGAIPDAADKIDHRLPPSAPVPEAVTVQHGAYVANACIGCHGANLQGGRIPGAPPDWPPAADLRPGAAAVMRHYPDAESFAAMLKTGKRPDGHEVSPVMPFPALKEMNETDVRALYLYLRGLPPRAG